LEEGVVGITGREKYYGSFSDHANGLFTARYARNHLLINPKNASLSGWVPQGWLESAFRSARKFFAGTAAMAAKVGKKGQGAITKEKLIGSDTQHKACILGLRLAGSVVWFQNQGEV
jgi:hypothetical protein